MFALLSQQHLLASWSALSEDKKSKLTLSAQGADLLPYLPSGGSRVAERVIDYRLLRMLWQSWPTATRQRRSVTIATTCTSSSALV